MIELKVGGKIYNGWKTASVRRSLNAFASSADFTVSDYKFPRSIPLYAPCQVFVNSIPVITGYIDVVNPSYNASTHEVSISCRSKTADLVDCAAIFDTGQLMNSSVSEIVRTIIAPFGIKLNMATDRPVPDFQLQQGETASAAIERLCSMHGLAFTDDAEGNLIIAEISVGQSVGTLVHKVGTGSERNNILSGSCEYSRRDIFSEYIVKSQRAGFSVEDGGEPSSEGRAIDDTVPRYRPLVLVADATDNAGAQTIAEWERSSRIGRSTVIDYTKQGWLNDKGGLWAPNTFVMVDDDEIRVQGKVIISEVSLNISGSGTTTALRLNLPEAFIPSSTMKDSIVGWEELRDGVKL